MKIIVRFVKSAVISLHIGALIVLQSLCVTAEDSSTTISTTAADFVSTTAQSCQAPSAPKCSAYNITKHSVTFMCDSVINGSSSCTYDLLVDCTVTGDPINQTIVMSDGTAEVTLTSLNASTLYNCTIEAFSSQSSASANISVSFQTKSSLPSEPINLQLNADNRSIDISWDPPEENAENITKYWVIIENLGKANLSHYVGENCTPSQDQLIFRNYTVETTFVYSGAFPDFNYNITVYAETDEGNGSKIVIHFVTPISESSPPLDVHHLSVEHPDERNMVMDQNITWNIPCNTNGPAEYFYLTWFHNETNESIGSANVSYSIDNKEYYYVLQNLSASSNYTVNISLIGLNNLYGNSANVMFETESIYPDPPELDVLNIGPTYFTLNWYSPSNNPGPILKYHLTIVNQGPSYSFGNYCDFTHFPRTTEIALNGNTSQNMYMYHDASPYYAYSVTVQAETARGTGNESNMIYLLTNASEPGAVKNIHHYFETQLQNDNYNSSVNLNFTPVCDWNGPNPSYALFYTGSRMNYSDVSDLINCTERLCSFTLLPQYNYTCIIETRNDYYESRTKGYSFISPSGVPKISNNTSSIPAKAGGTNEVSVSFSKQSFDWSNGDIQYVAIIVSNKNVTGGEYGQWDGENWPQPMSNVATVYYQATTQFWNPWKTLSSYTDTVTFTIGTNSSCNDRDHYCNRPLSSATQYFIIFRAFTSEFFRNSWPVAVETDVDGKLHFILGMTLGLLFTLAILIVGFILWKKGIIKIVNPQKRKSQPQSTDMNLNNFLEYCNYLEQNPDVLKKQYADLCAETELACSEYQTTFAQRPENRRKNRYINILPYDHTRVKLHIDENDEMCSDYINASYIQGFGGEVKYISTQGPLFSTCRDFWRMIIQEDVHMIIMVARFVEGHKDKCYKYFPKKGENMVLGDDMEVRCCTELDFGIYCIRSLQVRKDLKQVTVTHMQFLQWPDFGVPSDPQNILQFYQHFKQRWAYEGGPAVIHCSAGVGRTGTLIATDILLQAIKSGSRIDVYNTVLELRKQRINMVQTEKQYMFIYSLVKNIIEDPMNSEEYNDEHFYENIDILAYKDEQKEKPDEKVIQNTAETEF